MAESKRVKIKVKTTSIVVIAFVGTILIRLPFLMNGNHGVWELATDCLWDILIAIGMLHLVFQIIFPVYISSEGLQRNLFFTPQAVIPWGEVDFDRIKRNKFAPFVWIGPSWLRHQKIFLPGYFHIGNSEEVLALIDQYTKKYRDFDFRV